MNDEDKSHRKTPARVRWMPGLSGKLLLLTIVFVMIAEVLIYVPSIANFRVNWLRDRLAAAHTAALVFDAAPSEAIPETLARQILQSINAHAVAIKTGDQRRLLAASDLPSKVDDDVDIRQMTPFSAVGEAFATLVSPSSKVMRLVGTAPGRGQFIEVILNEQPLRQAMLRFSVNILLLSLVISAITAMFVYFTLHCLLVRPMRRITNNLIAFHRNPESHQQVLAPTKRRDEIGIVEHELAGMQRDLVALLNQKTRLASLGLAVSKINHDLRNLLSSAQLISDQLVKVPDARVQKFAPKLVRTLERAIAFCQSTLSYGAAREAPPERRPVAIAHIASDVRDTLGLGEHPGIEWIEALERELIADADPDHLFRIVMNIARNAVQALESIEDGEGRASQIRLTGKREGAVTIIEISDTGPGVPLKARDHLFQAFQGAARPGGTGLGLAIAAELVRSHGGAIELVEGTIGATFRITLPDRPVPLHAPRERAQNGSA